ncbi:GDP-mannose 4,6-dehydratase [freshwater metagenome]|jgi:GDPmannose 4,6-dehydratase|uniref:GDP-mannose 4,6-dehydratase n=1 Tax=freshwater metagenome TaxID=449393 RepID=A0A094SH83_9ZZZZ
MSRKVALITGVTGQDGSYLAEFLLVKGYEVHGLIRRSSTFNTSRIDHIYQDPHEKNPKLFLHYGDLIDGVGLTNLIREIKPTEVYNLGAQSHVQVSFTMPQYTGQVDAVGAVGLLEAIRSADIDTRFYQASTSELFGSTPPPQNENSVFRPQSPYAAAKLMAYWCTVNYRDGYGMHATNGILFNHESPRRGETFVTRKITRAVAAIKAGKQDKLFLGNLDAVRDWGYAKEYVESMWLMLQQDKPDDYVVATGVGATVKDFAEAAFSRAGLNWQDHIETDKKYIRPTEVDALIGDPSKAEKALGWKAATHWKELAELMVDADIVALQA